MNNLAKLLFFLSVVITAVAVSAQTHPNFSGKWKLNVEKSEMGMDGVTALTVDVDHKDPVLSYTVRGIAGGQPFEQTESFTTDGKSSKDSQGNNVKCEWDGAALVVQGTADDGSWVFLARLTLSEDGKTMVRAFSQKDDPKLKHQVFEKQ
jgi:hypothetical protein